MLASKKKILHTIIQDADEAAIDQICQMVLPFFMSNAKVNATPKTRQSRGPRLTGPINVNGHEHVNLKQAIRAYYPRLNESDFDRLYRRAQKLRRDNLSLAEIFNPKGGVPACLRRPDLAFDNLNGLDDLLGE